MGAIAMLESVESSIRPFLYLYVNKQRLFYQKCEVNNRNVCSFHRKGSVICIATRECLSKSLIFGFYSNCLIGVKSCRCAVVSSNRK